MKVPLIVLFGITVDTINVNTGKVNTPLYSNTSLDTKLSQKINSNKILTPENSNQCEIPFLHTFGSNEVVMTFQSLQHVSFYH